MARKSKQDWLKTGLQTLGEAGPNGLTIERMTGALGVTKGSFYHHFENMGDFQAQLIAYWADQYTSTANSAPDSPAAALALLDKIMAKVFTQVTEPEVAIRVWAQQDDRVCPFVERVDATRRAFVLRVFWTVTGDETQARLMADMLSTILIGSITTLPRIPPERTVTLYREFKRLYGLEG